MARPDADAVVIVAGLLCDDSTESNVVEKGNGSHCHAGCLEVEACDRPSIAWPGGQEQLIQEAASWALPMVLVIISGGPLDLEGFAADAGVGAILWMGYPGQEAGNVLASLVFGEESPSGRLTHTFYKGAYIDAIGRQANMNMRHNATAGYPGRTYRFVDEHWVVYPFGHGLSYHTWRYNWVGNAGGSRATVARQEYGHAWEPCRLDVEVSLVEPLFVNAVPTTSILLFLKPPESAGPSSPKKKLHDFKRVRFEHGQRTALVSFTLVRKDFELSGASGQWRLVEGTWSAEANEVRIPFQRVLVGQYGCHVGMVSP